jgi:hypothetical protein
MSCETLMISQLLSLEGENGARDVGVVGREPTLEEIAEVTGIDPGEVDSIRSSAQVPVSLEKPVGDEEQSEFGRFIADEQAECLFSSVRRAPKRTKRTTPGPVERLLAERPDASPMQLSTDLSSLVLFGFISLYGGLSGVWPPGAAQRVWRSAPGRRRSPRISSVGIRNAPCDLIRASNPDLT